MKTKPIRISKTEDKIVEHIREKNEELINDFESFLATNSTLPLTLKLFNILNGNGEDLNDTKTRKKNLLIVKRLNNIETNFIIFIRLNREKLKKELKQATNSPIIHKLYNLIANGCSKTFDDLLENKFLSMEQYNIIQEKLSNREKILITGGLNTGKITLLNAMLYMFEKKCEQKDILVIDELSEIQVNVENDGLRTITDLDNFTISDIHNINEESLLVFSNIHSWNELFLIKSIPNDTQLIGSIYKEEYLEKIKEIMNEPISIINLEQVDGAKRIREINTLNKN